MKNYNTNTLVRMTVKVTQATDGEPANPSTLTAKILLPDNTIVDLTSSIVNDASGEFHVDYTPVDVGVFTYQWLATGNVKVSAINQFRVIQATF